MLPRGDLSQQVRVWVWDTFSELIPTSSCLVFNWLSLAHRVRLAINSFLFSLLCLLTLVFPFEFLPANQNSVSIRYWYVSVFYLGACCYDYLDFGNLLFSLWFVSPFYICFFLYHRLVVDLYIWLGNSFQSTRVPNYFT